MFPIPITVTETSALNLIYHAYSMLVLCVCTCVSQTCDYNAALKPKAISLYDARIENRGAPCSPNKYNQTRHEHQPSAIDIDDSCGLHTRTRTCLIEISLSVSVRIHYNRTRHLGGIRKEMQRHVELLSQ
jgi:hypothetical protein